MFDLRRREFITLLGGAAAAALMDASGTSDRTPRTPGQFRRSLSAAPLSGAAIRYWVANLLGPEQD